MKALLVSQRPSDWTEIKRAALALKAKGMRVSIIYYNLASEIDAAPDADLKAMAADGVIDNAASYNWGIISRAVGKPKKRLLRHIFKRPSLLWIKIKGHIETVRAYLTLLKAYRNIIQLEKPDVIILPEDVVGMVTPLWVRAGHLEGVPSLVLPYTICNELEAFRSLVMSPQMQVKGLNRVASWLFPEWIMEEDGRRIVRLPAGHIIGHWLAGCLPPDPWQFGGGWADAIAVENEAMRRYYRISGMPASRLKVVGAVYDDELAAAQGDKAFQRTVLNRQLNLDPEKPLLVVAGCPDQSRCCPRFAYPSMDAFYDGLAWALLPLEERYEIVFRPHPNLTGMMHEMSRRGIKGTVMATTRMVALADAYVGFASATIRWAIACGLSTINYDVFGYGYSDFRHVPGVTTVSTHAEFKKALAGLPGAFVTPSTSGGDWGRLDGKATDRIMGLIEELTAA